MQALRHYVRSRAKTWWATPPLIRFLTLLGSLLVLLSGVELLNRYLTRLPGPGWADILLPLALMCNALSSILDAQRTQLERRDRVGAWVISAGSLLVLSLALTLFLSRS
jgi:hypothetical protein